LTTDDGSTAHLYPAYYANCIAVAATDASDAKPYWSNYGDWVDVGAPGVSIYSTLKDNGYGYKSGTSMASPYVAGLAALVFTTVSDTNGDGKLNDEVRNQIEATCDDIGVSGIGHGRINAYEAVGGSTATPAPPPPSTGSIAGTVNDATDDSVIAGATVSCNGESATTDSNGQFTVTDLTQGAYTVTTSATGYTTTTQTVEVAAGEVSQIGFALTRQTPPSLQPFWVQSITFGARGRNLYLSVKVISARGPVAGAQVAVQLTSGVRNGSFSGTTDSTGLLSFTVSKPSAGDYVASVIGMTATGYTWDTTQGVISATYTINSGGRRK
jgi:uncharacterized surface anchored protein